jgi:hypothetical protein
MDRSGRKALRALSMLFGLAGPALAGGGVVDYIEPRNAENPPPAVPLDTFARFEIRPITMDAPYAGQDPNEAAKASIQANLDLRVQPVLAQWNAQPAGSDARTLRIEPEIRHIRYISGGKRFWGGAFAGGSAVLMTVKLTDAATGQLIAEPEFYQHANKMGAAWSFGATDKAMLIRIGSMVTDYLQKNYSQAVGGSTSVATDVKF